MIIENRCASSGCEKLAKRDVGYCEAHMLEGHLREMFARLDPSGAYTLQAVSYGKVANIISIRFSLFMGWGKESECYREWDEAYLVSRQEPLNMLLTEMLREELELLRKS